MTETALVQAAPPTARGLTREEARVASRALNRRRLVAFALVTPLLAFVAFAFFAPVATMLHRSVHNPTVVELIPDTLEALQGWSGAGTPPDVVLTTMAIDLKRLASDRTSGKLAEELNRGLPGTSSVVKVDRTQDAPRRGRGTPRPMAPPFCSPPTRNGRTLRSGPQCARSAAATPSAIS